MPFLTRLPTLAPTKMSAGPLQDYTRAFFSGDPIPNLWLANLNAAGIEVTPDLALTLSAFYCAVSTISYDLATLPPRAYETRADGGKTLVLPSSTSGGANGMAALAYRLRWAPNAFQTSAEFFLSMIAQFLTRSRCYAEIIPGDGGPMGWLGALLPRHPDRVTTEMLPNGRVRYKLQEPSGGPRYLTQDQMFSVRDMNMGMLDSAARVAYASQSLGTALATGKAAAKFFKTGMMASALATYQGEMDPDDEKQLHASISRYATGVDNSFGLLLVPDSVKVENLSVEPEKAQMMLAQEWGVKEVARYFRMPLYKFGVTGSQAYASQVQSALDYVITCLRPTAVTFEQAFHRDLVMDKDRNFIEFPLDELLRGDPDARAQYYERAIRNRWMRPSEVRLNENMNPDEELDRLSAKDFQPGAPSGGAQPSAPPVKQSENAHAALRGFDSAVAMLRGFMAVRDNAARCLRRERVALGKMAKRNADNPDGWKRDLQEFYGDHAQFVSETMRLPIAEAREYAALHGTKFETTGIAVLANEDSADNWEREESDALATMVFSERRQA